MFHPGIERAPSGYPHLFYSRETAERALQHAEQLVNAVAAHFKDQGDDTLLSEDQGEAILE
jgi:hypothetical protein